VGGQGSKLNGSKQAFLELTVVIILLLTLIVRTFNSVFMLRVLNFFRDSPLNHCMCLTINVYILWTKDI